jgi:hypothetical protein
MKRTITSIALIACFVAVAYAIPTTPPRDESNTRVIYVVRHAEKDTGPDPVLTEKGTARAERLSNIIEHEPISAIFVTDTQRSRLTGHPTATIHNTDLTKYAAKDGAALRASVEALPIDAGALVVAHSNTVSIVLEAFGARPIGDLPDDEYARLYAIVTRDGAHVRTIRLAF